MDEGRRHGGPTGFSQRDLLDLDALSQGDGWLGFGGEFVELSIFFLRQVFIIYVEFKFAYFFVGVL